MGRWVSYLDNLRVFVRVVELGNLSAAGRDQRASPAVVSNRIKELEKNLGCGSSTGPRAS
ncbi:LysR family transcriptional regulator [Brucella suis bv. 1]|nr:LysR family transcriptional regulator [Brucella suis bv. 1]